ncbi:hypothetical protein [Isoptericola sediminis]|uniref:Uncharacterized protein n=1 Tax=Isoptericola sediminis TaxID=2733572 RepID=A0A849K9S2_9MICO|nr:hypothetical protein [Isoptericola sediminis]NNU27977.1 hypothetical protein [Isoptericola sediminis]
MDTKTVHVETVEQAHVLQDVKFAADRLRRSLGDLRHDTNRQMELLDQGYQTQGLSHQTLQEVVQYQGALDALIRTATYVGLTSGQIQAVTTTPDFVSIRSEDERSA